MKKFGLASPLRLLWLALLSSVTLATAFAQTDDYTTVYQLLRSGKLTEAQSRADHFLSGKPRDPQMRFLKGVIQREAGKISDAQATFTKLTEDYPELPEPYNNLAVIYASQGQYDKARAALEMAIRTNPSYATAHENLGDIYARLASQAYSKALQLDTGNAAASQPKLALIQQMLTAPGGNKLPALAAPPVVASSAPTQAPVTATSTAPVAPAVQPPAPRPIPAPAAAQPPVNNAAKPAATPPVAAAPAPAQAAAAKPVANTADHQEAEAAVRAWAQAWSSKDINAYLAAYGKEFDPPGKASRAAWEAERRKRILGKSRISVKLENLIVTVEGHRAEAKFRQDYRADALSVSSRKTLELVKTGNRWLIVRENTGN